jgi:4-hydroxy-2-oxoheptanedioate aldolase
MDSQYPMNNFFLTTPSNWTAELMAHAGFDSITLDMQHGLIDLSTAVSMLQAISTTDCLPLIRAQWNSPAHLMQMLDAGAQGIICPMIYTPQDAEKFVAACQYPPLGIRSFGPIRAQLYGGENYFNTANEAILKFAMIETKEAYENLEAIAAVEGLTGLYVGPFDLSVSMELNKRADFNSEELLVILERVLEIAAGAGLKAGVFTVRPEDANKVRDMGFDLISCGDDTGLLKNGAKNLLKALKRR